MNKAGLQLGNLVYCDDNKHLAEITQLKSTVAQIKYTLDGKERHSQVEYERLIPIPIDFDWLYKLGFTKDEGNSIMYSKLTGKRISLSKFQIGLYNNKFATWLVCYTNKYGKESEIFSHIDYVHQLQNLYELVTIEED